jgi:putative NIF3 family GTP cyclohydrolase 1 type 2
VFAEVERLAAGEPALIFTHHPMDFETSERGLLPISDQWLSRLRDAGISLYAAHAPLDCHEAISTSRALARAVSVPAQRTFAGYMGGHAGVYGSIDPVPLDQFMERVKAACGVERVTLKNYAETVERVGVVAGGAAFPGLMEEALAAGCDTYLTGDFQVRHGGPWAEQHRPEFDAFVEEVQLNLIGGSHYATEAIVLREDILQLFSDWGLEAEFVPQSDPWR